MYSAGGQAIQAATAVDAGSMASSPAAIAEVTATARNAGVMKRFASGEINEMLPKVMALMGTVKRLADRLTANMSVTARVHGTLDRRRERATSTHICCANRGASVTRPRVAAKLNWKEISCTTWGSTAVMTAAAIKSASGAVACLPDAIARM
jgi:hypothetical protein